MLPWRGVLAAVCCGIAVALATIAAVLGREAAFVIFAATAGPTADDIGAYPSSSRRLAQDSERKQQKKEYQKGERGLSEPC